VKEFDARPRLHWRFLRLSGRTCTRLPPTPKHARLSGGAVDSHCAAATLPQAFRSAYGTIRRFFRTPATAKTHAITITPTPAVSDFGSTMTPTAKSKAAREKITVGCGQL
jgi:hypothetical protein